MIGDNKNLLKIVDYYNQRCENITGINPLGDITGLYYQYDTLGDFKGLYHQCDVKTYVGNSINLGFGLEMRCIKNTFTLYSCQGLIKQWIDSQYDIITKPEGV